MRTAAEDGIVTCEKCGADIPEGASACRQCETPLTVGQIGPVYVPETLTEVAAPEVPRTAAIPARPPYASFWLRAVACLIDIFLILLIFVSAASLFPSTFDKLIPPNAASLADFPQPPRIFVFVLAIVISVYFTLFEASVWQATPGKRLLRLYVTDLNGRRISFRRALVRNLARQLSGFLFIGYLLAGFTEKKQALHDLLAGSLVLRRP
jgi:uncharacterized RDD family membrane protein YckC